MPGIFSALADHYRIERELGAGGMATVYLAHDIKHERKVAIKVLKPELAAVLGAERFIVEIKTTAALQHPHILPLFDSGEADGFLYYVMPYIEGETIREKLNRETQFGIDETVRIACEVADALDYAHRHGVIHRDIKPENILLHDGRAMVMDFGIALAVSAAAGGRMTETGLSLGTPHYMSPEQATAEKQITARSDIYSLASVLYEMLTGSPPHTGASAQQIIMKIIAEPVQPVTALRKSVPPNVAAAVAQALEKLPADRFAAAKQFADVLLGRAQARSAHGTGFNRVATANRLRDPVMLVVAGIAIVAVGAAVWLGFRASPPAAREPVQFVLSSETARPVMAHTWNAAVSPDGQHIVYAGEAGADNYQFYARRIDGLEARPLPGTLNANQPLLSPDGRWVAFEGGGQLFKVQLEGGTPVQIAAVNSLNGAAWSSRGEIILGSEGAISGLARVSEGGGALTVLTRPDTTAGVAFHLWPIVLQDGHSIVFAITGGCGRALRLSRLAITSLDDGVVHLLGIDGVRPLGVVDDRLVYLQADGTVMSAAIDLRRKKVTGSAEPLLDSIPFCTDCNGDSPIYLSSSGALTYIRGALPSKVVWTDASGAVHAIDNREERFANPRISPDGRRIAVTILGRQSDVWIYEIATSSWNKLTSGGNNAHPEWTPDGSHIVFVSDRESQVRAWQQAADFGATAEVLTAAKDGMITAMLSHDKTNLLISGFEDNTSQVWSAPALGKAVPKHLLPATGGSD